METTQKITLEISFTRRKALALLTLFFLCWRPASLGSETLTMTTYYPAPYGGYARILTTNQTILARDSGNVGIGTNAPVVKLDVRGGLDVRDGDIRMDGGRTISSTGRMHVTGGELLYLLNASGVIVGREWGGTGNLQVQGNLDMPGNGAWITGNNLNISGLCSTQNMTGGWTSCPGGQRLVNVGHNNWTLEWTCVGVANGACTLFSQRWIGVPPGDILCCRIS